MTAPLSKGHAGDHFISILRRRQQAKRKVMLRGDRRLPFARPLHPKVYYMLGRLRWDGLCWVGVD
jgi:hypothetical protein